ncbi:DUF6197 family protein [Methylobacterium sp. SyP6R]|uniref:DUF6197 family protein n=1 Tax=Methylobacterium sp. SyP6R TaxID=2718876 RepID=UPI001F1A0EB1|nr:hypothetical protein [Methylobacterium sp. SyP6R]MCF4125183.1 hypothetical protein [Methylobacterium sp. SyP6R]
MPVSPTMRASLELAAERIISILDQLDQDPDLEDGADAEPSLGAPEGYGSQVGWMRGGDRDLELEDRSPVAAHQVIARMIALLADPARWCRGAGARDAVGRPCSPTSPRAVAWSLEGAIDRAAGQDPAIGDVVEDRLCALLPDMAGPAVFNDWPETAHEDVVALLRQALASAA